MAPSKSREKARLSHEQCRRWTCFSCRRKTVEHPIDDFGKDLVNRVLCQNVPWDDPCIPCGLCPTCRENLIRLENYDPDDPDAIVPEPRIPVADFRQVVVFPPQTRAVAAARCECLICQVHYPGGLGKVSPLTVTTVGKGKGGRPKKRRTEEERLDASIRCTPPRPQTMCPTCKLVGAQEGDGHDCNLAALTRNTRAIVEENPVVKERVAASILKSLPKSPGGTIRLSQATGGPKAPVSLGRAAEPQAKTLISVDAMATLQQVRDMPMRGLKQAAAIINRSAGHQIVEEGFMTSSTRGWSRGCPTSSRPVSKSTMSGTRFVM